MPYSLVTMRTLCRDGLNEATARFFTDAQLDSWIAAAALEISAITHCVQRTTTRSLEIGQRAYLMPEEAIQVDYIQFEETGVGMPQVTPAMAGHSHSVQDANVPLLWYQWGRNIYVDPAPATGAIHRNITLFYRAVTDEITALAEACQILALPYVCYRARLKDRQLAEAALYYGEFINGASFRRTDAYAHQSDTRADIIMPDSEG